MISVMRNEWRTAFRNKEVIPRVLLLWCVVVCIGVTPGLMDARTFYLDAVNGNDANDGRTTATAWRTLTKVNATTFVAADTLLLKSGNSWTGQLKPRGSGSAAFPIIIDKYGGTTKPLIMGGGVTGEATVYLNNQEYWEINNLEITNDAATSGDRRGVLIAASNFGVVDHIVLRNLDIHNVKGIVGQDDAAKRTAGIGIETTTDASTATRFNDILIEGCVISVIENTGLYTDNLVARSDYPRSTAWMNRRFTNVRIQNNVIHHISKNAMIIRLFDKGVIEHNVCYETALQTTGNTMFTASCDSTVFQYNEGYYNRSPGADGSMYDADLRSPRTIWQYSYSHNNAHGLFWTCTVQADSGVICRYNVSQNDQGIIFCINYPNTSVYCYNNTVYCDSSVSPIIISERNVNSGTRTYSFYNNIIYSKSPTTTYDFRTSGYTRDINYNLFYGYHPSTEPADPNKMTANPNLMSAGSGGIGIGSVLGYALLPGSPCLNSGKTIPGNGGLDYIGNPVPFGSGADRGAFESQDSIHTQSPESLRLDGGFEGQTPFASLPSITSLTTGAGVQSATWTIGVSSGGTEAVVSNSTLARSGDKYAVFGNIGGVTTKRLQSPTAGDSAVHNATSYVVQFYYRTNGSTVPTNLEGGISPDGTSQSGINQYAAVSPIIATGSSWQKATCLVTSASSTNSPRYGLGHVRFNGNSTIDIDVDDYAVYEGTVVDTTAPGAPGAATAGSPTTTSLDLSWSAPAAGVDGGGYLVVRGTSDPVAVPHTNGIYAVGNLLAAGQKIVYTGSATSFEDTGLVAATHYYYRVYAVDKAFNYSAATLADGSTSVAPILSAQSGMWNSASTWVGGVVPAAGNDATIVAGHTVTLDTLGLAVRNLVVQPGAKLRAQLPRTTPRFLRVAGTTVTNDGMIGGSNDAFSFECGGSVSFQGGGIDSVACLRPATGVQGATILIDKDMTFTYAGIAGEGGAALYLANGGNDNITLTVDPERVITFLPGSRLAVAPTLHVNPSATYATNAILNLNGVISFADGCIGLETYTSKTTTVNIGGSVTLHGGIIARTSLAVPGTVNITIQGSGALVAQSGSERSSDFDFCHSVADGLLEIDSLHTAILGQRVITGGGVFTLASGGAVSVGSPDGLALTGSTGNIQTSSRNLSSGGNYKYAGVAAQTTGTGLPSGVHALTVSNMAGVVLSANVLVADSLYCMAGSLDLNGHTVTLADTAWLRESRGQVVKGTSGVIQTTRVLNAPSTTNDIGGLGLRIGSNANLGTTVLSRGHAVQTGNSNSSIKRYYDVQPANNSGLDATLIFGYDSTEVVGFSESLLSLFRSTNAGSSWIDPGVSTRDTVNNTLTLTGIDSFSRWTAGDSVRSLVGGGGTLSVGVPVMAGWNLISNPVTNPVTGDSVRQLFPTAANTYAFDFSPGSGYTQRFRLTNGIGYWEKFATGSTQTITGTALLRDTVDVVSGWNIVGSLSSVVDTSQIVSIPPGIRASNWFAYAAGYSPVSTLAPGTGVWVKASAVGKFILASATDVPVSKSANEDLLSTLGVLTISDRSRNAQSLYFGECAGQAVAGDRYEMPPLPPAGAFDARFSSGRMMEAVERDGTKSVAIHVTGAQYPLSVQWDMKNNPVAATLHTESREITLVGTGSVTLFDSSSAFVLQLGADLSAPKAFALAQNYPNPFNPSTLCAYDLPENAHVTLTIFDVLGRQVATIVNENQSAGHRSITWNAVGCSSGLYFLRLQAGKFTATRKLLLIR
jgi:hypothetical protein